MRIGNYICRNRFEFCLDDEFFSKAVRAGKRTYFFDVKSTRKNELYLIIIERKRRYEQDGSFMFEKHKIFLYKEDFEKFADGLSEVVDFIKSNISNIEVPLEEFTQALLKNNFTYIIHQKLYSMNF